MGDLEKRVSKLEDELAFIIKHIRNLASGSREAFEGVEAELLYIKSHLGLTQAAPDIKKLKRK